MDKKQWLIFTVGCFLAAGLFCALGRFTYSPSTVVIRRTVNSNKSITVLKTVTGPHFQADKIGRAMLGFLIVIGGTVFATRKIGPALSTHSSQTRLYYHENSDVWPPPPQESP